jgi:hypothetical protein
MTTQPARRVTLPITLTALIVLAYVIIAGVLLSGSSTQY